MKRKKKSSRSSSSTALKPWRYQKRAIKFMVERGAAALFLDPGLGKTAITYAAFEVLRSEGLVGAMLVIAPLRVAHSVWPREAEKWSDFNHLHVVVLHGSQKEKLLEAGADVYVINPEGLSWLASHLHRSRMRWPFDMLVIDESTRFKNTRTQRFKTLKPMLPRFNRRYILTGTPAPNGLLNLFGQVYVLDGGRAFGKFISHFRIAHFYQSGYGGYTWKIKEGHDKIIYEKIQDLALRMSSRDHLDLPEVYTPPPLVVDLPEKARRIYDEMEEELIAELDSGALVAANAAAASAKCRQIAGGAVYDSEKKARHGRSGWHRIHDEKIETAQMLVEELGEKPVLMLYEFNHERERLLEVFGKHTPYIGSGVSTKEGLRIEERWNAGDIPLLLAHPASVAHGLNLQDAPDSSLVWYTVTWDLELYDQAWQRLMRQGRKTPLQIYRIVARDTVDSVVLRALSSKSRTQGALLTALKKYRRQR